MQNNNSAYVTTSLRGMRFGEQRRFWQLVRNERVAAEDAVRVVEHERNRQAITPTDVRDLVREQNGRRTVATAHVYA